MKTSPLSERIVQRLHREAVAWDRARIRESESQVAAQPEEAEAFKVRRPVREPVSVRHDPQDIFLLKRLARRKGIPSSQLIAVWVREQVSREAKRKAG